MEIAIKDLAQLLGGTFKGDGDAKINNISKIEEGIPGTIAFLSNPKYEQYVYTTQASAVLVKNGFEPKKEHSATLVFVDNPYNSITILLEEYERIQNLQLSGREEPAYIHPSAEIGENEYIAAFAYINKNVKIGKNVKIHPHVYIGQNVTIGDNCIILTGAKILENTVIGSHCTFHPNCVIGSDGFGFAPQADDTYKRIPQVGNVVIGDHVCVGAGTAIDCATMGSTIIHNGVKLDNLIQVAHNVEIGENTVMAAHVAIAGSTKIGKNCILGGKAGVVGHIKLADRTTIAASSMILKDSKPGDKLFGFVAFDHVKALKSTSLFKSLPEINERIKQLEEKVLNLTSV